jgi:hypothetical protein
VPIPNSNASVWISCSVLLFSVSQDPMDSMIFVPSDLIHVKLINSKKHFLVKPRYILDHDKDSF